MNALADKLAIGTVSWGMPYGLPGADVPSDQELQQLVRVPMRWASPPMIPRLAMVMRLNAWCG